MQKTNEWADSSKIFVNLGSVLLYCYQQTPIIYTSKYVIQIPAFLKELA